MHKIKRLIKSNKNNLRVVIGSSKKYSEGWIPTQFNQFNILNPKHWAFYFHKESIDAILAEHVWEHLSEDDGMIAANYCYSYLKPGGYIRLAVPDGNHPSKEYIDRVKPGGTGAGAMDHKVLYSFELFSDLFIKAGFKVEILEYFDATGDFNSVNWDISKGKIQRSAKYDDRNKNGDLNYTSIILDAYK